MACRSLPVLHDSLTLHPLGPEGGREDSSVPTNSHPHPANHSLLAPCYLEQNWDPERSSHRPQILWLLTRSRSSVVPWMSCSKLVLSAWTQPPKPTADALVMRVKCQKRCRARRCARVGIRTTTAHRFLERKHFWPWRESIKIHRTSDWAVWQTDVLETCWRGEESHWMVQTS